MALLRVSTTVFFKTRHSGELWLVRPTSLTYPLALPSKKKNGLTATITMTGGELVKDKGKEQFELCSHYLFLKRN